MTYQAIVTTLKSVREHPNADRLKLASCHWNQVVIGLNNTEWELWVYFPVDWRLSEDFATRNDLVRRKDADWNPTWGMFDVNRNLGEKSLNDFGVLLLCLSLINTILKNEICSRIFEMIWFVRNL